MPRGAECFLRDEIGRRLFYPFGLSWSGYVLPDAKREASVRDVMASAMPVAGRIAGWISVPGFLAFGLSFTLLPIYPFAVLAALVLPTVLAIGCYRIILLYRLRPLLNGLEQVDRRDKLPRYARWTFLAACAAAWFTLQSFGDRLSQLPTEPGTTIYYADISLPLAWVLLCAFTMVMTISLRKPLITAFGSKVYIALMALAVVEVGLIAYTNQAFRNPTPRVFVTSEDLTCDRHIKWSDVADVAEVYRGTRPSDRFYAQLRLDAGQGPFGNYVRCQISGLNENHDAVYRTIRAAWLATRRGPPGTSTGDTLLDQIKIGATRQRVLEVYGSPTVTARTPDGSLLLYYSDSRANAALAQRLVTAIYFGTDDNVERLARYSVRDGKIFDSISQRELTSGVEYPFLETLFFSKPRAG